MTPRELAQRLVRLNATLAEAEQHADSVRDFLRGQFGDRAEDAWQASRNLTGRIGAAKAQAEVIIEDLAALAPPLKEEVAS
jgi:hypothetical protein